MALDDTAPLMQGRAHVRPSALKHQDNKSVKPKITSPSIRHRVTPKDPIWFMILIAGFAMFGLVRLHFGMTPLTTYTKKYSFRQHKTKSSILSKAASERLKGADTHIKSYREDDPLEINEDNFDAGEVKTMVQSVNGIKIGTIRGPWRWTGDVWRRVDPNFEGEDFPNNPLSWFDRRTVQSKLDFFKFIDCHKRPAEDYNGSLPSLEGLPIVSKKVGIDDFIVHQGNFQHFGKGEGANRTDMIRHPEDLPFDGENTLRQIEWGKCAIVGNSGTLKLTEFGRSIDSHDTVLRLNIAPAVGYPRRVGHKTTHRLLNKLWTRTYRNSGGKKKGHNLPMEEDLWFLVSRANSQEYELLNEYVREQRPDVKVLYLSSRAASMSQPLLTAYRHRLCRAGLGPYKGLNVPSSGYVAIQMLQRLCESVTVYGFGVTGMGNCRTCGLTKDLEGQSTEKFQYHYYKGVGSRHVGDDVHSFDTEEKILSQLGREGYITTCTYQAPIENEHNWQCGCAYDDIEECRPFPRNHPNRPDDDSDENCGELGCERLFRSGPSPDQYNASPGEDEDEEGGKKKSSGGRSRDKRSRKPVKASKTHVEISENNDFNEEK